MTPLEIKALRIELGLTQQGLAAAMGVARTRVLNWERGEIAAPRWFGLATAAFVAGLKPYCPSEDAVVRARTCRRIDPGHGLSIPRLTLSG